MPDETDRRLFFEDRLNLIRCSPDCLQEEVVRLLVQGTEGFTFANLAGYMRNLQIVFFDKLSQHADHSTAELEVKLQREDLLHSLKKVEPFGLTKEFLKLSMIYEEFKNKGSVADKQQGARQILM